MKRGRSRKDIFPQVLSITTANAGDTDDYVVQDFALPVSRVGTTVNKAQVVEIIWVDYYMGATTITDTACQLYAYLTTANIHENGDTATLTQYQADISRAQSLAPVLSVTNLVTSGELYLTAPLRINLTDSAGNGVLVATSQMTLVFGQIANAAAAACTAKIAYRIVEVGITEYVGIVESQSAVQV